MSTEFTRVVGSDVFSAPSLKLIKRAELFERIFNTADVFSLSLFSLFLKIVGFLQSPSNILSFLHSPKAFVLLRLRLFLSSF